MNAQVDTQIRSPEVAAIGETGSLATHQLRAVVATAALACYSGAALASYVRVFGNWDFVPSVIGAAFAIHAISLVARLLKVSTWVLTLVLPLVAIWLFFFIDYRSTLRFWLPTGSSVQAARQSLSVVVEQFPTATPPIPLDTNWLPLAVASAVLIATTAELFAFAARGVGEALAPGAFVFVLVAALGDDRDQIPLTLAIIITGIVTVGALGWYHDRDDRLQPVRRPVPVGLLAVAATALLIAFAASWVGPRLPGAQAQPMIDPTDGSGGGSVTTITSPLVDIRSRLTNQSEVQMFAMSATSPSYWRSTTLPEFDGESFRLPARELESVDDVGSVSGPFNTQKLRIAALGGQIVPAAAEPREADGVGASGDPLRLRINRDTSTLLAPDDLSSRDSFNIVSEEQRILPADLENAPAGAAPDEIYRNLPDSLPPVVATTAAEVTASGTNQYQKMLALQDWFREFDYSVDSVPAGHSNSAIEAFLQARVGYCEQFSATFAAMARTLGYSSRVAVGFTTGDLQNGEYVVRGRNSHAWPEIYFEGVGWVPFEPTPGQGIPGAEDYTGVTAPEPTPVEEAPTSTTRPTPDTLPTPNTQAPPTIQPAPALPDENNGDTGQGEGRSWLKWMLILMLIGGIAAVPSIIRAIGRAQERNLDPERRTVHAWQRSLRAAQRAGAHAPPGATPTQWVTATAQVAPVAARPMQSLAETYDVALYASEPTRNHMDADEVTRWADQVEEITTDTRGPWGRVSNWFRLR